MNIAVLIKQTFDTEEKIIIQNEQVIEEHAKFIMNPYDEYALEEAIRLKERFGGTISVISASSAGSGVDALRTALAMGADEAVLIADTLISKDEYALSFVLSTYLRSRAPDLILGGHFSVDHGSGQVAIRIAELLGIPHIGAITSLDIDASLSKAIAHRDAEGDTEVIEVPLPALFTAQQGLNEPRYPSLQGIIKAKKKPFATISLADLGLQAADVEPKTISLGVSLPPQRGSGHRLTGQPHEQAAVLTDLLQHEAKVIAPRT